MRVNISSIMIFCVSIFLGASALGQNLPYDAVVKDDENNVREFGGENYKQAKILGVLNKADRVHVLEVQGRWARVDGPGGLKGWLNKACLEAITPVVAAQTAPATPRMQPAASDPSQRAVAAKNGKPVPMASPGHEGYLRSQEGCLVWDKSPVEGEKVSWSGACVDGFAHGVGVMRWTYTKNGNSVVQESKEEVSDSPSSVSTGTIRVYWVKESTGTDYQCSGFYQQDINKFNLTHVWTPTRQLCKGTMVFTSGKARSVKGEFLIDTESSDHWKFDYLEVDFHYPDGTTEHYSKREELRKQELAQRRSRQDTDYNAPPQTTTASQKQNPEKTASKPTGAKSNTPLSAEYIKKNYWATDYLNLIGYETTCHSGRSGNILYHVKLEKWYVNSSGGLAVPYKSQREAEECLCDKNLCR